MEIISSPLLLQSWSDCSTLQAQVLLESRFGGEQRSTDTPTPLSEDGSSSIEEGYA